MICPRTEEMSNRSGKDVVVVPRIRFTHLNTDFACIVKRWISMQEGDLNADYFYIVLSSEHAGLRGATS